MRCRPAASTRRRPVRGFVPRNPRYALPTACLTLLRRPRLSALAAMSRSDDRGLPGPSGPGRALPVISVAERRSTWVPGNGLECRRLRTSLRDEDAFGITSFRGLKPPATFEGSLRDPEATEEHFVILHQPRPATAPTGEGTGRMRHGPPASTRRRTVLGFVPRNPRYALPTACLALLRRPHLSALAALSRSDDRGLPGPSGPGRALAVFPVAERRSTWVPENGVECRCLRTSLRDEDVFWGEPVPGVEPPATFEGSLRNPEATEEHFVVLHEPRVSGNRKSRLSTPRAGNSSRAPHPPTNPENPRPKKKRRPGFVPGRRSENLRWSGLRPWRRVPWRARPWRPCGSGARDPSRRRRCT